MSKRVELAEVRKSLHKTREAGRSQHHLHNLWSKYLHRFISCQNCWYSSVLNGMLDNVNIPLGLGLTTSTCQNRNVDWLKLLDTCLHMYRILLVIVHKKHTPKISLTPPRILRSPLASPPLQKALRKKALRKTPPFSGRPSPFRPRLDVLAAAAQLRMAPGDHRPVAAPRRVGTAEGAPRGLSNGQRRPLVEGRLGCRFDVGGGEGA